MNSVERIQESMCDFIEDEEAPPYLINDVKTFGDILVAFKNSIRNEMKIDQAVCEVKSLVLGLNKLNELCDYSLIETDQREDICQFVFDVLEENNIEFEGDITEEWRDW